MARPGGSADARETFPLPGAWPRPYNADVNTPRSIVGSIRRAVSRFAADATAPDRRSRDASPVGLYRNAALQDALLGALTSLPDPDYVLARVGITRAHLRELEHDDEISAALDTRRDAAVATPWSLDPPDGAATAFIAEQIHLHADAILRGAWNAVPYGYSVSEAIYRERGGRVELAAFEERPIEWFTLRRDGAMLVQVPGTSEHACLPGGWELAYKFFLTRRLPSYRQPYGEALLSRLYWPWFFRRNAWRFWGEFLERFGAPILLGKARNPQDLAEALVNMGASMAVAVGIDEDVEAVTQGGTGEFERAEAALARRIQKVVLGQTLTTDVGSTGSFAAAKVHNDVRADRRNADLRLIGASAQRVVDALWALNRFPGKPPVFAIRDEQGIDAERAERDARLVQSGAVRLTKSYFVRTYDFDESDIEDSPAAPPLSGKPLQQAIRLTAARERGTRFTARQQQVEDIADGLLRRPELAGGPVDPTAIRAAVLAASDPEDLADRLAMLMPAAELAEFSEALARALFAADVLGYAQEQRGGAIQVTTEE